MSQDKPVLTAGEIELMRGDIHERYCYSDAAMDQIDALCDLALSALDRHAPGWVSVPREPTKEMLDAGYRQYCTADKRGYSAWADHIAVYHAMLAASPHNDHEPPQAAAQIAQGHGPASGSPDHVRFYIDGCAVYEPGYVESLQETIRALEAERQKLSKNFEIAEGAWRAEKGRAESLQHQLAQRGEWLSRTVASIRSFDPKLADYYDATIRKALGETA